MNARRFLCILSGVVLLVTTAGVPASADDFGSMPGLGFGTDIAVLSPLDATTTLDMGAVGDLADAQSMVSSFSAGESAAQAYAVISDAATDAGQAATSADIARQAQAAAADRRQAAAAASAAAAACPTSAPGGTLRSGSDSLGVYQLCVNSVAAAATEHAAAALVWAFARLGDPYACGGVGRMDAHRFDCSSLVSRAYHEGAGLSTATASSAPSTRDMVPWGGAQLSPHYSYVAPGDARPGDLVLYDTGGTSYRHVVMLLSDGYMLHTNSCGDVAHVTAFWGYDSRFLVARRVVA